MKKARQIHAKWASEIQRWPSPDCAGGGFTLKLGDYVEFTDLFNRPVLGYIVGDSPGTNGVVVSIVQGAHFINYDVARRSINRRLDPAIEQDAAEIAAWKLLHE